MKVDLSKLQKLIQQTIWGDKEEKERQLPRVGDTVEVTMKLSLRPKVERRLTAAEKQYLKQKMKEGYTKEELEEQAMTTQVYKGVVIAIQGSGMEKRLVIRRVATNNVGVERIIPVYGPSVIDIKVVRKGKPRRAKLYYLRNRVGRKQLYVKHREE